MIEIFKDLTRDYWKALTHPTPQTFIAISDHANGRLTLSMVIATLFIETSIIIRLAIFKNSVGGIVLFGIENLFFTPLLIILWGFFIYKICCNVFHRDKTDYGKIFYVLVVIITIAQLFDYISLPVYYLSPVVSSVISYTGLAVIIILSTMAIFAIGRLPVWQSLLTALMSAVLSVIGSFILFVLFAALTRTIPRSF